MMTFRFLSIIRRILIATLQKSLVKFFSYFFVLVKLKKFGSRFVFFLEVHKSTSAKH
jgi:hypothetical protein